ncbi:lysophospholipase L1-like esterase [Streptomyces sp. SAI-124]
MKKYWAPLAAALAATLGMGAAWPATATATEAPASVTRAAAPTPLRLMPLGNSITWGVGSPSGNSYRSFLANKLTAEGHTLDFVGSGRNGTMSDPDNEGHSGWRIDQIAGIADSVLARYRPNVVTLEIGTNDLNGNYQIPTAARPAPRAHRPDHQGRTRRNRARRHRDHLHQRHRGGQPARVQRQVARNRPGPAGCRQARTPGGHERPDHRGPLRRPAPQRQRLRQDGGRLQRGHPGRGRGRLDQAAGFRGRAGAFRDRGEVPGGHRRQQRQRDPRGDPNL